MKAALSYDQIKAKKSRRATSVRQFAELRRFCQQYPGADCDVVLAQRENLYNKVKQISSELEQMAHESAEIRLHGHPVEQLTLFNRLQRNASHHIPIDHRQQIFSN